MTVFSRIKQWLYPISSSSKDLVCASPMQSNDLLVENNNEQSAQSINYIVMGFFKLIFPNPNPNRLATFEQLNPPATAAIVSEILDALKNVTLCDWHLGDFDGVPCSTDRFGIHVNRGYMFTSSNRKIFHFLGYISTILAPISSYLVAVSPAKMLSITLRLRDACAWVESNQEGVVEYNSQSYISDRELFEIRQLIPQIPYKIWSEHDAAGEPRQGVFVDYESAYGPTGICQMGYDSDKSERCATSTYIAAVMPKNVEALINLIAAYEYKIRHTSRETILISDGIERLIHSA